MPLRACVPTLSRLRIFKTPAGREPPMRMLGHKASLQTFRWDLVDLAAQLVSDKRAGVSALAAPIQGLLTQLGTERGALEQAEDAVIVASAILAKSDRHRDEVLIEAGGVARASNKDVYQTLFPNRNPSATARLPITEESAEIKRILGEMGKLAADHALRTAYEAELTGAEAAVKAASEQSDEALTALALQRSQLDRFKLELDKARLEHARRFREMHVSEREAERIGALRGLGRGAEAEQHARRTAEEHPEHRGAMERAMGRALP